MQNSCSLVFCFMEILVSADDQSICSYYEQLRETPQLLLDVAGSSQSEMALQSKLRQTYPAELVRAAISLVELRKRAQQKFSRSDEMWFTRLGFEQATAEAVAFHKAKRFAGVHEVYDLCSGIGMDSIALASMAKSVIAVDDNPLAGLLTRMNAELFGATNRIETKQQRVEELDLTGKLIHLDPDRRVGKSRAIRLEDYIPSLEFMQNLTQSARGGAIKLSPASNFGGKFPESEIELISFNGECKEATVWFGVLGHDAPWRATILPSGYSIAGDPLMTRAPQSELQQYLYDPDPALVRAGLIDCYAVEQNLSRLDPAEEYLTSLQLSSAPGIHAFEVLEVLPNNDKAIRKYFREASYGDVEIKCRHIPIDAEKLRKKLALNGKGRITLIFARINGKAKAVVCRRTAQQHDL